MHKTFRTNYPDVLKDQPVSLSIVVTLKNRTSFTVKHNDKQLKLELFRHNVEALKNLHKVNEQWQLVVVDFGSTDVNIKTFLKEQFASAKSGFSFVIVEPKHPYFNLGLGRNIGVKKAIHDEILVLDADMVLRSRELIKVGHYYSTKSKCFFPICLNYKNPNHTKTNVRSTGAGIVYLTKSLMNQYDLKWKEIKQWGNEDVLFFQQCHQHNLCARAVIKTLFHQWHPVNKNWKNRFTEQGAK